MTLKGKHALVTGGSRGIGRGIALKLAEEGAQVAVHYYVNETAAKETLEQVRKQGADGCLVQADVSRVEDGERMFGQVRQQFGTLDVFVATHARRRRGSTRSRWKSRWKPGTTRWTPRPRHSSLAFARPPGSWGTAAASSPSRMPRAGSVGPGSPGSPWVPRRPRLNRCCATSPSLWLPMGSLSTRSARDSRMTVCCRASAVMR